MDGTVTIGEFSRLTHLTAKALRHYHDVGLLVPAQIDSTGYRRYGTGQVQQALLVRRLRDLEMPVPDIKALLAAPDDRTRDLAIADHLQRMEQTLGRTAQLVASLRTLLQNPNAPTEVEYRTVGPTTVLALRGHVPRDEVAHWCAVTFPRLYQTVGAAGTDPAGAGGATYDAAFFEQDRGEVLAFVPVAQQVSPPDGPRPAADRQPPDRCPPESLTLPGGRFAVAVHAGSFADIDRAYGRLGTHVADHDEPMPLPIREHYLVGPNHTANSDEFRTEIWWPIAAATTSTSAAQMSGASASLAG